MRDFSELAMRLQGQPMFKVLDRARQLEKAGHDIVHLEIGDPDFMTPAPIVEAAKQALDQGLHHYTSSWGWPALREVIQKTTKRTRGFLPDLEQILVVPGANIGIFYAVACLANPGDEVLIPDPGFPTYSAAIAMCGAKAVPYPLHEKNAFRLRAADIEPFITTKTRLIIINSPQNPTGAITEPDALREVYALAAKHNLYLYSDEIYARMVHEEGDFFSPASLEGCRERVILSNGFSKAFAMTGWRLGALVMPHDLAERMMLLLQTTSSCVPPFIQAAGIAAIEGDQEPVKQMMAAYKARRERLVSGLNAIEGITCHKPGGAFYAFPNIRSFGLSSEAFCQIILEKAGVALLPGSCFGEQGEGFVRLCYATSESQLDKAIERISEVCKSLRKAA